MQFKFILVGGDSERKASFSSEMNVIVRLIAAVTILIGASLPAHAQQWEYLATNTTGSVYSVDVSSIRELAPIEIRRDFAVRQIWVRIDASKDSSVKYRTSVFLQMMDCSANKALTAEFIDYGARGEIQTSGGAEDYSFNYKNVAPGTIGSAIIEFGCGRSSLPGYPPSE